MADVGVGNGKLLLSGGAPHSLGDSTDRMLDVALRITGELGVQVAIGINAGVIFCGEVGSRHPEVYAAIGDAVNLAARVTAKAQPGQVLCEASTFGSAPRHLRGRPRSRRSRPRASAGRSRRGRSAGRPRHAVPPRTCATTRSPGASRPSRTRAATSRSSATSAAAVSEGGTRVIQIVAPAGMGKSTRGGRRARRRARAAHDHDQRRPLQPAEPVPRHRGPAPRPAGAHVRTR